MSDSRKPLLLCQSYGSPEALHETLVCLLSLKHAAQDRFKHLDIKMMEDCFRNHGRSILYFDSDTYFTKSPEALFEHISPTSSVFFNRVSNLVNPDHPDLRHLSRTLKRTEVSLHGKPLRIPPETELWDCTLLGLHQSHRSRIGDVLGVCDELYALDPVPNAEQLAFSFILGQHTSFHSASEYLVHYRPIREALQPHTTAIFAKRNSLEGVQEALELAQNPPKGLALPRKGFLARLFGA
jgi:hypothetical protein